MFTLGKKLVLKTYNDNPDIAFLLEAAEVVEPSVGEVLIRVHAASINPIDSRIRSGYGRNIFSVKSPLPNVLGRDFSGEIIKVGENVTQYKIGDEVWGIVSPFRPVGMKQGSHASYLTIPIEECQLKPKCMMHIEAASIPYVALTTWTALITQCRRTPEWYRGKNVFLQAGAGGVGTFAIQLLKHFGATVITTCSTENLAHVRALGADEVIDYKTQRYSELVKNCDVVYDLLGKTHTDPSLNTLKSQPLKKEDQAMVDDLSNRCLTTLDELPIEAGLPVYKAILKEFDDETALLTSDSPVYVSIVGPLMPLTDKYGLEEGMQRYIKETVIKKTEQLKQHGRYFSYAVFEPNYEALIFLTHLANEGKIKAHVGKTFSLNRFKEAYTLMDSGHARGKVMFEML